MKRKIILGLSVLAFTAMAVAGLALAQGNSNKATICHKPPGNPSNTQTMTVGQGEVAGHQQHGDTLGPCPASPSQPGRGRGRGRG